MEKQNNQKIEELEKIINNDRKVSDIVSGGFTTHNKLSKNFDFGAADKLKSKAEQMPHSNFKGNVHIDCDIPKNYTMQLAPTPATESTE